MGDNCGSPLFPFPPVFPALSFPAILTTTRKKGGDKEGADWPSLSLSPVFEQIVTDRRTKRLPYTEAWRFSPQKPKNSLNFSSGSGTANRADKWVA